MCDGVMDTLTLVTCMGGEECQGRDNETKSRGSESEERRREKRETGAGGIHFSAA